MVEAGGVAESDGVGGGEEAEAGVGRDDAVLIQEGEFALLLQDALDDEHDIGAAGVVFVKDEGDRTLEAPGEESLAEFGDLLAVAQDDGIASDEVDARDVSVKVDADAGPVQARGDLFNVGGFAGAVVSLDHDASAVREAGEDGERGVAVKLVAGVGFRNERGRPRERRHLEVAFNGEGLRDREADVGVSLGEFGVFHGLWSCGFEEGFEVLPGAVDGFESRLVVVRGVGVGVKLFDETAVAAADFGGTRGGSESEGAEGGARAGGERTRAAPRAVTAVRVCAVSERGGLSEEFFGEFRMRRVAGARP